jgi:transcriptional antiterminator RfaH
MPILKPEVQCFPEGLLTDPPAADSLSERRWWVLHTKPRQEKSVARQLLALQIPFFLPQTPRTSISRGRKRQAFVPLFANYVFLHGTEHDRRRSLETNRLVSVLSVADDAELWTDLRQIHRLIESKAPLTVESRLEPGQRVRVKSGSFAGLEGTVLARRRKTRLLVVVRVMQQGVSCEVDDFLLEPI